MTVMEAIEARRAYRSLQAAEAGEALARDLSRAASLAASCFNHQPWRFVFAYEPVALERVKGSLSKGNRWAQAASLVIAACSRRDLDCPNPGRELFAFDTGMAAAFLILRATELGLVAHPIAGYDEDKVREALGIPADMAVIALVIVGRHLLPASDLLSPAQKEGEAKRPERKPLEEIMRLNRF
ncbi:MAG TPA: nitroreductase family protein [Candidatus Aminicenantes bacterium]|nr:nitroreductase family protein [Candidatus Aminicenantes bacterium]